MNKSESQPGAKVEDRPEGPANLQPEAKAKTSSDSMPKIAQQQVLLNSQKVSSYILTEIRLDGCAHVTENGLAPQARNSR
jgi:hypothetical protein